MKRIVTLLVIGLAFSTAAFAQPTLNIVAPDGDPPCTNDDFCVTVEVADFTDILSTEYYIDWDSTVLQFNSTGAYNLPGLTGANFTQINAGRILLSWEFDDCNDPGSTGHTILADGTVIYEVCFTSIGDFGTSSQVIIPTTGDPDLNTPFIRRKSPSIFASCANIGLNQGAVDTALIANCLRPFIIDISDESGNEGDLVCIDFRVNGFDDLTGFQFPVVWDSTKAVFEEVIVSQNLPNFNFGCCFGVPGMAAGVQEGSITVIWNAPPPTNITSVPDSTLIFQLCLRLKDGSCGMDFDVAIGDEQPGQEFFVPQASNDAMGGFPNIPVGQFSGGVALGDCNPTGVKLIADCGAPADLNDNICVQVEVGDNFMDVSELEFLMEWNPEVLSYTGVQGFNLLGLTAANFQVGNTANGILGLEWDSASAQDRPDGTVIFEVCFDVIGLGGNSPFTFINNEDDIAIINGNNVGINPTNCAVSINQPPGVVIDITGSLEGQPGDTLSFDFPVTNFTDILSTSFSIVWEPNNIEYQIVGGLKNINVPGLNPFNFNFVGFASGQITVDWETMTPVTLPDGTSMFTLCFIIPDDAAPGTCDVLSISSTPLEAEVITSTSNGEDVGLTGTGGDYCILSPDGFFLEGLSVEGDLQDTVCLPYVVSDFDGITDASFCLTWNPGVVELLDIVDNGLIPGLNIDIMDSPVGSACFDFSVPGGLTLADSANVFDLCFELLGPADTCYTIEVSDTPQSTVNTLSGPGSLLNIDGEICINDRLFITVIDSLIVPESCPGAEDGCIQVLVSGGVGPYIYSWGTSPTQQSPKARFLGGGEIELIIIDQSGLSIRDTFFIPTLGGDLFANAGPDRLSSCDPNLPCTLVNPTVSVGDDIVYRWTAFEGGAVCGDQGLTANKILLGAGPGLFVIEVIDTSIGCFATDTIRLLEPFFPPIGITTDTPDQLTCNNNEVLLTAEFQSDTLLQTWIDPLGNETSPSIDSTTFIAQDSGMYILITEVVATQCQTIDSILIDIDTIPPPAIASPGTDTTFIGCNDLATLVGFAGDNTADVSVRWLDAGLTELTTDSVYVTSVEGIYYFEVTNDLTGCTNIDSTFVVANEDLPVVNILQDPPPAFDCNNDPIELTTEVLNIDPSAVMVQWEATAGGTIEAGTEDQLSPTILTGGDYMVTVTSELNGCEVMSMITVAYDTIPPVITINEPDTLTCVNDNVELNATIEPADGEYSIEWFSSETFTVVDPCMGCDPAQINVGLAGTYIITVEDTLSGCVAIDSIEVMLDTLRPIFALGDFPDLTCIRDTVSITTSVLNLQPGAFSIDWMPQAGTTATPTIVDDSIALFLEPGEYLLEVTNLLNGCTREDSLIREIDQVIDQPQITFESSNLFVNCLNPTVLMDASGSTQGDTLTSINYQWDVIVGSAEGSLNGTTLTAEAGGIYEFTVTNENSGCFAVDTVFVQEDFDEPLAATATDAVSLVCSNNMGFLDATGSTEGPNITYIWREVVNGMLADTFYIGPDIMVPIAQGGVFCLEVYDADNGCRSDEQPKVDVITDGDQPQIVFGTPNAPEIGTYDITCDSPDTLLVSFFVTNDTLFDLEDLVFTWSEGFVVENDDQLFSSLIPLDEVGAMATLTLTVVDAATGCTGENEYVIEDIRNFPTADPGLPSGVVGCDGESVTLNIGNSSMGDTISYTWENLDSLELGSGPTFEADTAGTYVLVVTNSNNNCTSSQEVVVGMDTNVPSLILDSIPSFDCNSTLLTISAAQSGSPADLSPVWTSTPNGADINGVPNTLDATVNGPGEYMLQLTNNTNGCDTMITFIVPADTLPPNLVIADTVQACPEQQVVLVTSIDAGVENVTWDGPGAVTPPNGLSVRVTVPGTYTLTVEPDNGCIVTASGTMTFDPSLAPVASLEADGDTIGCANELITLIYTGIIDTNYLYDYTTVAGDGVAVLAEDSLSATVDMAGSYALILTDSLTGCMDTSAVIEIAMVDLEEAIVQIDSAGCGDVAIVSGNLPEGATGQWSSASGLAFSDPTGMTTSVSGFSSQGDSIVWTLSYDGCPDFSATTLGITAELAPIAVDDELLLGQTELSNTVNVVDNDQLSGVSEFTISISENPTLGNLDIDGNGDITYTLNMDQFLPGMDEFAYEICNKNCPDLCDIAFVSIEIDRDSSFTVPNGFTPNEDGLNDEFVFDQLLADPERYENNELIIFNRWGDIVFEAQPYNNDWRGQNMGGEDLPDGTYYYILRLNIGDGEILRGDVTIIR